MTIFSTYERLSTDGSDSGDGDRGTGIDVTIDAVRAALFDICAGRPVIVVDTTATDHQGHLMMAARSVTTADLAWLIRHTSGILCVPLAEAICDRLHLPQMVRRNESGTQTAFTVSVDATDTVSTGISAGDRAITIRLLADSATEPDDLSRPGHVFPIRAAVGGVLVRPGQAEAAVDLVRLAGAGQAAVMATIVNDDDTDVTASDIAAFALRHQVSTVTVSELIAYRWATEQL